MAEVINHKSVGAPFSNEREFVRVVWDFSVDGGGTGAKNLLTAVEDVLIKDFHAVVKTATDSATDAATLDVGIAGGDTDLLIDQVVSSALTLGKVLQEEFVESISLSEGTPNTVTAHSVVKACPFKLASGASIAMTIGVEAFTAGKIEFVFEVMKI